MQQTKLKKTKLKKCLTFQNSYISSETKNVMLNVFDIMIYTYRFIKQSTTGP